MNNVIIRLGNYKEGFSSIDTKTQKHIDEDTLLWIKTLRIPPAYTNVLINKNKKSKILAIGYDTKGRKQYIYNPIFVAKRSQAKYKKIIELNQIFFEIKNQINKDIQSKDEIIRDIAIIIYIIIHCGFRVGNKSYEKSNGSFGVSTIRYKHLKISKGYIYFDFVGKKGVRNIGECNNTLISKILHNRMKESQNNSEQPVFPNITSSDVNKYLKQFHPDITTKDLRTWNANNLFINYAKDAFDNGARNPIKKALELVANKLHNTAAVCKKNYVDPDIIYAVEEKIKKMNI
jgi:DNA topoisomerase-1